jgi:hypothetical protein
VRCTSAWKDLTSAPTMAPTMRGTLNSRAQLRTGRRNVAVKAWKEVASLLELQQAQHKRIVVPVESGGDTVKILVQELNGETLPKHFCKPI